MNLYKLMDKNEIKLLENAGVRLEDKDYNKEELKTVCARGLQASLVGQVLVEESILGWEELELEVVRDAEGNMITVCFI